jgi:hypothetical protein
LQSIAQQIHTLVSSFQIEINKVSNNWWVTLSRLSIAIAWVEEHPTLKVDLALLKHNFELTSSHLHRWLAVMKISCENTALAPGYRIGSIASFPPGNCHLACVVTQHKEGRNMEERHTDKNYSTTVLINGYHVYRQPLVDFFGIEIAPNLNQSLCDLLFFLHCCKRTVLPKEQS